MWSKLEEEMLDNMRRRSRIENHELERERERERAAVPQSSSCTCIYSSSYGYLGAPPTTDRGEICLELAGREKNELVLEVAHSIGFVVSPYQQWVIDRSA